MPTKKSARSTVAREKLLVAAGDVFAEKGFAHATVAEICKRAGTNVAAVNYYFGSKEALYQEAWRQSFAESLRAHPPDGGVSADAPAEARLRGQIKALIDRVTDVAAKDFFISQMELVNPTGLLEEVMQSELIPLRRKTLTVVRELLGPQAGEQQVIHCEICIIGMCLHPMLIQRLRQKSDNPRVPFIDDLDAFTEHVILFALAGIGAVRRQYEKVESTPS